MSDEKTTIEMTADEKAEFEAFKAERDRKRAEEQRKAQRAQYAQMVDREIADAMPLLMAVNAELKHVKSAVYGNFDAILKMKSEVLGITKDDQRSHTFTTSDSRYRITLGVNTVDGYRDTVDDGIAMVMEYLGSLAKDDDSRALVAAVTRLMSRDNTGNIKASRVLQLRRMAEDSNNPRFIEGVRIIEEAYQPTVSKRYIRAEYRNDKGAWVNVPLGMTDVD